MLSGSHSAPVRPWLISWFWQKAQSRLQPDRKMVPEPPLPTRQPSSPWWAPLLATMGSAPMPQ